MPIGDDVPKKKKREKVPKSPVRSTQKSVQKEKSKPVKTSVPSVVPVERLKKSALLQKDTREKLAEKLNINLAFSDVSPPIIVAGNINTRSEELVNTIVEHSDVFYSNSVKNQMGKTLKGQGVRLL